MAEELTPEQKCGTWALAVSVLADDIKKLADKIVLSPEDKKEMKLLLEHIKIGVRALSTDCGAVIRKS